MLGVFTLLLAAVSAAAADADGSSPQLSRERAVFTTEYGDIHMAFYPKVGPNSLHMYGHVSAQYPKIPRRPTFLPNELSIDLAVIWCRVDHSASSQCH
jgi:hypothetical protein